MLMIRGKTICYSSYKKREKSKMELDLDTKLTQLYESNNIDGKITTKFIKRIFFLIKINKSKGDDYSG